ncbi:MAG: sugar transferase [Bacteroidales bacterium]|nr:sugar transferase [Bacteroidales bacterium]MDZ4203293.1 sugar transferase [Bacteroidales bacterium]
MYRFVKRILDVLIATMAMILLSPLFLLVILILLFTGEHEVFYLQERIGYLNRPFKIIKFATMVKNSPNIGTGSITLRNDPRVTKMGRILRKTKINELPQIFNVLAGTMSMVGPRPQMMVDFMKFPEHIRQVIYQSKPGITGIGSIVFRDEEKWISNYKGDYHEFYREHIAPYKGELEIWYRQHASIGVDLTLLFITFYVVVFPKSDVIFRVFQNLPKRTNSIETVT